MSTDQTGPKPSAGANGSAAVGSKTAPPPARSELTTQMEGVLQLLNQRMEGHVSTTQVESAVSDLLTTMGARKSGPPASKRPNASSPNDSSNKKSTATCQNKTIEPQASTIQEDEGNYDDSSDEENEDEGKAGAASSSSKEPKKKKRRIGENSNDDDSYNQHDQDVKTLRFPPGFANENEYRDVISQIPMGKEAAKMMTTFGDGPHPLPDPLELALMGTRKALQVSIMDARKVRRRLQKEYRNAQSVVMKYNPNRYKDSDKANPTVAAASAWALEQQQRKQSASSATKDNGSSPVAKASENNGNSERESGDESGDNDITAQTTPSKDQKASASTTKTPTANSIDPRLVYRALAEGTDKLSYAHKCGFHMEELTHLYPEEMRAYQRWNQMHEEYSESKADDGNENDGINSNDKEGDGTSDGDEENEPDGGHLRERAANFDYRTDQMKNDWYVEYAKVRQGSFLPNIGRVRRTKAEIEWDRLRKLKKGRHAAGEWENMSGRAVRFLHWLGFDPPNLYPPDEETTQALAFLAYDRLGRIVEKAIFLRNEKDEKARSLWEIPPGEQLTTRDIERALEDPDIKPATVYGTDDSNAAASSVQLYFGPGWEDRLELEMEEMVASLKGSNHQISEEERMVRNHEIELLAKISAPPGRDGDHLETLVKNHKENATES